MKQSSQMWNPHADHFKKRATNSTKAYPTKQFQPEQRSSSQDLYPLPGEEFNLATFKTAQCPLQDTHNRKHCPYFHSENDRRRNPTCHSYKCDFCMHGKMCEKGDMCEFSHNKVEQLYHPNRYRTKYCESQGDCEYVRYCSFAHSNDEILIPQKLHLIKHDMTFWMHAYKTVWCPYIQSHDRGSCVYAHNAQDFRRDPRVFNYVPDDCQQWIKDVKVTSYQKGGCPQMANCGFCHGWKENEYHPSNYKTRKCSNGVTCKKKDRDCAYFHNEDERRQKPSVKEFDEPKLQLKSKAANYDELNSAKKMPIKSQSNFNGPIIPTSNVANDFYDIHQLRRKIEIGQPFEVFSSSMTGMATADSRKMSDVSYETNLSVHKSEFQSSQTSEAARQTRTTPGTPDQGNRALPNQSEFLASICQRISSQYSQRFTSQLIKRHNGPYILGQLKEHHIVESVLMLSTEQDLRHELRFLSEPNIKIIADVLEAINIDDHDDDLLKLTMEHQ